MQQTKKLFGDRIFADVIFELKGQKEKKQFYAHSGIISARCDSLLPPKVKEALGTRKKVKVITIEIKDDRGIAPAFAAMLEYLYSGVVRFPSLHVHDVIELFVLADHYKLDRLRYLAKKHYVDGLKIENISEMLKAADELKCAPLKAHAMAFAFDNYSAFIADKNGAKVLGVELFSEVVSGYASRPPTPAIEDEPPERLAQNFKEICDKMIYPDATAICAKNDKVYFHKAFLACHSEAFAQLLSKDDPSAGYDFKSLSADAFRAMLRFLYYNDQDLSSIAACELVAFTRQYELPELQAACKRKLGSNVTEDTAVEILKQTCSPGEDNYRDVKENALSFASTHLGAINIKELKEINVQQAHYIACELLTAYQNVKKHGVPFPPGAHQGQPNTLSPRANGAQPLVAPPSLSTPTLEKSKKDKK